MSVHAASQGLVEVVPPADKLSDAHGNLFARSSPKSRKAQIESPPVWVIQESKLTYEAGEGFAHVPLRRVGSRRPERGSPSISTRGNRQGLAAIAEVLAHLNTNSTTGLEASGRQVPGVPQGPLRVRPDTGLADPDESEVVRLAGGHSGFRGAARPLAPQARHERKHQRNE